MSLVVVPYLVQTFGYTTLPTGARPLRVAFRHGNLWLWALVDTKAPMKNSRKILVCSDSEHMPEDPGDYVGSAESLGGSPLHVFDQGEAW